MPGLPSAGTLVVTERHDTLAGTSNSCFAILNKTESRDSFSGVGTPLPTGVLTATEARDSFSGSGWNINAVLSATEHRDTLAATTHLSTSASMAATERRDSFSGLGWTINGAMDKTEGRDTAVMTGTCIVASMAVTERHDSLAGSGSLLTTGSIAKTAGSDTLAASGRDTALGSISVTARNDTSAISGTLTAVAVGTLLAGGSDTMVALGFYGPNAALGVTERRDTMAASGSLATSATMAVTERHDTMAAFESYLEYNIYSNTGTGDPIDYTTPIATTGLLTWTSGVLTFPGTWKFAVRAFDVCGEDQNVDAVVTIVLDAGGVDISNLPVAPMGLRAFAVQGGGIKVEWFFQAMLGAKTPTGFHVYDGTSGSPNYASPVATVLYADGYRNSFRTTLTGLTDGVAYTIGVRSYNATSEEKNTVTVTVTADTTAPLPPYGLTGAAVSEG